MSKEKNYPNGWNLFVQVYFDGEAHGPYWLRESDEMEHGDVLNSFLEARELDIIQDKDKYSLVGEGYFRWVGENKKELQPEGALGINEEHLEKLCKQEGTVFEKKGEYYYISLPDEE
jgi:hypothetical protein